MSSVACRICLRTNVPTLDLPDKVETFHDQLCDFESVQHKRLKYCASCAYQMKKYYKFKLQCLQANRLLKLWIKHQNKDISEYHKELPSTSLQITNNSTSFLFECQHDEKSLHNTNVTSDCNRSLVLKLNSSALASDDRIHPESSNLSFNSNPGIPDRPYPDLKSRRLGSGQRPALRSNIGSRPASKPNLSLRLAFKPNLSLRLASKPNISLRPALKPNPGLGLSIPLVPPGCKQPKPTHLTFNPDFDVSYKPDPLSVVKDASALGIDENTVESVEKTMEIDEKESILEIKEQGTKEEVCMDVNTIESDDAIASVVEIEQKEVDNNECTIGSTQPEDEELSDNDAMDNTIDIKEGLINNENNTDNTDIESEEYTYEYLEQDVDLLDFATKPKQEKPSEDTSKEAVKKQPKRTTVKEPLVTILKIKYVPNENVLQQGQNEINIPLKTEGKRITRKYNKKGKETFRPPGFKAVPNFKASCLIKLFDESPLLLEDGTFLTKELFSAIYDKFNARELKRLAVILLEDDFRAKLTAYLTVLYRKYNPDYESVFHVEYLHTNEKKKEEFKRRALHPDYIRAAYKCDLCYKTYTGQIYLDSHKKIHHDPASPFQCSICSYSMRTRTSLIKHRIGAHQAAYTCKLCPLRTNLVHVMRTHYNTHKGVQYECPVCFKICFNANTLNNHKRRAHATHVCTTCGEQYTTEKGLRIHRETQHKESPPVEPAQAVPCAACDVKFDTQKSYQRHYSIAHTPQKRFLRRARQVKPPPTLLTTTLPKVKKEKVQDIKMEKKIKKKKKNKKVYRTCEVCHEKVNVEKSGALLYKHFLDKHPGVPYHATGMKAKDYLCDECGKAFYYPATLREHKNSHTGLRPFMCDLCSARFHTKSRLWGHRAQKHGDRRHRCEECGKMFKNSTHLSTHMKIHIGDRRFKCDICNKGFLFNSALMEHVKGVHYKERRVKKPKKPVFE